MRFYEELVLQAVMCHCGYGMLDIDNCSQVNLQPCTVYEPEMPEELSDM